MHDEEVLLQIKNLTKYFPVKKGFMKQADQVKAVDGISFEVYKGETLGIVGESGSGKSTLGRTIVRLYEPTEGEIIFDGQSFDKVPSSKMGEFRKDIQMIFQDPFASLNPRMRIGEIIAEPLKVSTNLSRTERQKKVIDLLSKVGMSAETLTKFPHEFSGGQRQRIGIARALATNPKFIIADEPVSALDVSVQSQVLNLMQDLQEEFNLTYLFISHDLSVVKHICDRVGVMYLGKVVEIGKKADIYNKPLHPYTQALLSAIPVTNFDRQREKIKLKGEPPSPSNPPSGCPFHTRCPKAFDRCKTDRPELLERSEDQYVACHLYDAKPEFHETSKDQAMIGS